MLRGMYLMPLSRIHNSYHVKGLVFDVAVLEPQQLPCLDIDRWCRFLGTKIFTILRIGSGCRCAGTRIIIILRDL